MSDEFEIEQTLGIETEVLGNAVVLRLSGDVDELGSDAFGAAIDEVMGKGNYRIVFDLRDVLFMCSTGLGQIMRTYRAARDEGGYVRIANPQPLIADLFEITKLNKILGIYGSVEEALQDEG